MSSVAVVAPITWVDVIRAGAPLLAALIAVGGVSPAGPIATNYLNNRRERDREEHERSLARGRQEHERSLARDQRENERLLKDAELAAASEDRLRDERIAAYRKLLAASDTPHMDAEKYRELLQAYSEVSLLATSDRLRHAATAVWARYAGMYHARRIKEEDVKEEDLNKATDARLRFLSMARKELLEERPRLQDEEVRKRREQRRARFLEKGREALARKRAGLQEERPPEETPEGSEPSGEPRPAAGGTQQEGVEHDTSNLQEWSDDVQGRPRSQEGTQRPWWRRWFGA